MYVYETFPPKAVKYTILSRAHGTFSSIDLMLGHKTSLNKFKKTEIYQSSFPTTMVWEWKSATKKKKKNLQKTQTLGG